MVRRKRSSSDLRATRQRSGGRRGRLPALEALKQQFTAFRRVHRPRTRIPASLRAATLTAIEQGVGRTEVRLACGVSYSQLDAWERCQEGRSPGSSASCEPEDARVFSVLKDTITPVERNDEEPLEFRLNGWSITLQRIMTAQSTSKR